MNNNLTPILDLIRKTGDKVIVASDFDKPYVLMSFEQYEQMINNQTDYRAMSESDILNKVNRDIALWKQAQREEGLDEEVEFFSNSDLQEKLPLDDSSTFRSNYVSDFKKSNLKKIQDSNDDGNDDYDKDKDYTDYEAEDFDEWDFEEDNWYDKDIDSNGKNEIDESYDEEFDFDFEEEDKWRDEETKIRERKELERQAIEETKKLKAPLSPRHYVGMVAKATRNKEANEDANDANKNKEPIKEELEEMVKYEHISPPPPITPLKEQEPVIDMSFGDENFDNLQTSLDNMDDGNSDFLVESIG